MTPELHLEDHGMARLVFDLYAPRGGVVRAGVDDRPREHCPGPDHPWRGDMPGAVVSELQVERLQHSGYQQTSLWVPANVTRGVSGGISRPFTIRASPSLTHATVTPRSQEKVTAAVSEPAAFVVELFLFQLVGQIDQVEELGSIT